MTGTKRPRIPYGYRMKDGRPEPEEEEYRKLKLLYRSYLEGLSLKECLKTAGVDRSVGWLRSIFDNEIYLGNENYPRLIEEELWLRAKQEAEERSLRAAGKRGRALLQKPVPVEKAFIFTGRTEADTGETPAEAAARMYRGIRARSEG